MCTISLAFLSIFLGTVDSSSINLVHWLSKFAASSCRLRAPLISFSRSNARTFCKKIEGGTKICTFLRLWNCKYQKIVTYIKFRSPEHDFSKDLMWFGSNFSFAGALDNL